MTPVNEFIQYGSGDEHTDYARWFLANKTDPATMKMAFMEPYKLFADFEGVKHRVTSASSMGAVCITLDFEQSVGYQKRVSVDALSNWSKEVAALKMFSEQLAADDSWAWAWHCHFAVAMQDEGVDHTESNKRATQLMQQCFGVKDYAPTIDKG